MKRIVPLLVALSLFLVVGTGCRKARPIEPVTSSTTLSPTDKAYSAETVRKCIISACIGRGWTALEINPGLIEAKLVVRGKHIVIVNIPYTADSFSIKYKSSSNMEHKTLRDGTEAIHPNYNKWVRTLEIDIQKAIATARTQ
ncbi:MAG: hypothetical protein LBR22_08200 [Desulfovibrio sp.]|jgi:hypothetical protein|nr:hypothetical protein [Desulfovibrio sp.]